MKEMLISMRLWELWFFCFCGLIGSMSIPIFLGGVIYYGPGESFERYISMAVLSIFGTFLGVCVYAMSMNALLEKRKRMKGIK
jgi:amino acid transporter